MDAVFLGLIAIGLWLFSAGGSEGASGDGGGDGDGDGDGGGGAFDYGSLPPPPPPPPPPPGPEPDPNTEPDSPNSKTSKNACEAAANGIVPKYSGALKDAVLRSYAADVESGKTPFSAGKLGLSSVLSFQHRWNLVSGAIRLGRVNRAAYTVDGVYPRGALGTYGVVGVYTRRAYALARILAEKQGRSFAMIAQEIDASCP